MADATTDVTAATTTTAELRRALGGVMPRAQREACAQALRAAQAAQDFLLLPTSDESASPAVEADGDDNLTPAQRLAVAALICGETFASAARKSGVTARQLYNWRQQPAFRAAVEGRSREAVGVVVVRVRNLMLRASRVLGDAMLDGNREGTSAAFRVLNSTRLWQVMERPAEADAAT